MPRAQTAGMLVSLVLTIVPSAATAQDASPPGGGTNPARLQLSLDARPPSTALWTGPPNGADFWRWVPSGSDRPQWTVEWMAVRKGPRGSAFSAGFFDQRGNPTPSYWPQSTAAGSAVGLSMTGPGTYRDRVGVTLGIRSPALTIKGAKISAFADVFVPVSNYCPKDPASPIFNSPVLRAGVMTVF